MTLTILDDLEQGSAEWHDARRGIVTASVVGKLITPTLKVADNDTSRGLTNQLAAERITGWTDETYMSNDMWRGVESEPIARDLYSKHYAPAAEVGFMRRDEDGWTLGYSPDGLVGDDGLIEIKAPRAKGHIATVLSGRVPPFYMAQCQAGLLVSGRSWLDFVSYVGGLSLWVKRVHPDPDWFAAIEAACRRFEENVNTITKTYEAAVVGLPATERLSNDLALEF
jgi:putative phage-type endonuclease